MFYDHEHEGPQDEPCKALVRRGARDPETGLRPEKECGAPWYSVLHPPDQFRHWCSTLEAGGDCMHFEEVG